jgi:hypothetical protein
MKCEHSAWCAEGKHEAKTSPAVAALTDSATIER